MMQADATDGDTELMGFDPNLPKQKTFEMPSALVILSIIMVASALATLVLTPGEYQRQERSFPNWVTYKVRAGDTIQSIASLMSIEQLSMEDLRPTEKDTSSIELLVVGAEILVPSGGSVRSVVIPNSYRAIDPRPNHLTAVGITELIANVARAPILGLVDRAQIIGFVLLVGGAFGIILSTGAIDHGLGWVVTKLGDGKAKWTIIPVSFTLFSLGGAVYGMGEDTIAFVLITVPFAIRLGYDSITGVAMCYMASQVGFAGAFFNPFTIGIAQGIAELPYLSGLQFRYVIWFVMTLAGILFTTWWAKRVEKCPQMSPTFAFDETRRAAMAKEASHGATRPSVRQFAIIGLAVGAVFVSGYCVANMGWFINEMAALLMVAAVICGMVNGYSPMRVSQEFVKGASGMVEPALIIAFSAGVVIVLQQAQVLDTILYALAAPLQGISVSIAAVAMMMVQASLNFFVPSGSGQAAMTMPLIAPLCDLIQLDRQVGVLAFQFGDGFGNIVIPTSAVLMGVLGAAKISWTTWVNFVWPFVVCLHVIGAIFLIIATYGPSEWMR